MNSLHIEIIAKELTVKNSQVKATAALIEEGATVPFIARYRKEATGSLDEVQIAAIRDRLEELAELDKRREAILKSLQERELLSDELKEKIESAESLILLEDIYLPFRPKRRTRATVAKEKGLEPLALIIFEQGDIDPEKEAEPFIDADKGVADSAEALAGARDIIAEWVSEDGQAREILRQLFSSKGIIRSRVISGKEEEGIKYKDYYEWEESVSNAPSHRILAIRRGEKEGFLSLRITPSEEDALALIGPLFIKGDNSPASAQVKDAVNDSYKRLLCPSMETEIRLNSKKRADEEAIAVFMENLRQLLVAPPLGGKNVLAIDPGFRTGCKVVCLDRQGKLLHNDTIYPHFSNKGSGDSEETIKKLCSRFVVEAIAIGNGTAGRETELFINGIDLPQKIEVVMVNESGASIYSASETAREEFPDYDVTVRGSVSIGRRLMDPLAELVKIDPKSIGVGQYQHDVDQTALKRSLDDVVVSCVNGVGVEVNTASKYLLTYVSGLGPQLAKSIVEYRDSNGPFKSRREFKKVSRLGPKAFEQSAGFLRIRDGENPLDASAVHPETYNIVDAMAKDIGCSVTDLMKDDELRKKIDLSQYVTDTVGVPTLNDIVSELAKPGRDPREKFEPFSFSDEVEKIEDVKTGMKLPGVITNVTAFGAFVDIGVHQDGLIHISELSDTFVKNSSDVVKVQQKVTVSVLDVDLKRKRISLSMKSGQAKPKSKSKVKVKKEEKKTIHKPAEKKNEKKNESEGFINKPFAELLKK